MRTQAPREHGVAVDVQVLRRDRCADVRPRLVDEGDRLTCGDMLEDDTQLRQPLHQRCEHPVDEHRLAVEDVDSRIGYLTVDAQRHADRRQEASSSFT